MMPVGQRELDPSMILGTREHAEALTKLRFPAVRDAFQWLTFSHLPVPLQNYSRPFYVAAVEMVTSINDCPELTHVLNRLIEAKDWAVRAGIRNDTGRAGSVPRPQTLVDPPVFNRESNTKTATLPSRPIRDIPQA